MVRSRSKRRVIVDLDALVANFGLLSSKVSPSICGAVVKANAYGLGVREVASALSDAGCEWFFVASSLEAFELREVLPSAEIVAFEGPSIESCAEMLDQNIKPVLNSYEDAKLWAGACAKSEHGACLVHVDSGMNRLGMTATDIDRLLNDESTLSAISIEYVMSHLACADEPGHTRNALQLERFDRLRQRFPDIATSIANSSAVFLGDRYSGDLARVGIAMYGGTPNPAALNPMQNVATVQGQVLQIRKLASDDAIGYGATTIADAGTFLATVAFGYAAGYPRSLGGKAQAYVGGKVVPVIGRISMDSLVVDVSDVADSVNVGDWVTLVGPEVPLDEVAALAGTISYEILVGLGPRVERVYAHGDLRLNS